MAAPRVLVVRFSSLGDVVLTTPLLRAIGTRHPAAEITFVTKAQYAPVLAGNPYVARTVALAPERPLRDLAAEIGDRFDHRLDLHASLRSLRLRRLLGGHWRTYRKHRVSRWRKLWFGAASGGPLPPVAERYFAAATSLDVRPDERPAEVFPAAADVAEASALVAEPFVALAPGARHRTKRWPPSYWRRLAELVAARGFRVLGLGTRDDGSLLPSRGIVPGWGLSLGVTAALLARARLCITNDSGLMHLASAAGGRVAAFFGPTVPSLGFAPYRTPATILEQPLRCRPCSSNGSAFCPLLHHRCLRGIAPETVAGLLAA